MELTRKNVVKAAKEFMKVIGSELSNDDGTPFQLDLKAVDLEKNLFDEMRHIQKGDNFSDETDDVFNELKIKYTPKPEVKKEKKNKKAKAVEVGTTVELDVVTDKIKNGKMKKEKSGADNAQVIAAKIVCSKTAKKDDLMALLDNGELYTKKQVKTLKGVTNFLSLKKQMKELLEPDVVAKVEEDMKATPKPAKAKAKVKVDPLAKEIKEAIKVKQLKKIAKANDQFNWKVLKALDFDEMQKAMLSGVQPVAKVKMIANPLIAEIEGFKKAKKLVKWAKAQEEIGFQKAYKKMDLADLQEALIASIPAEIEAGNGGTRIVVNHIDQAARRERLIELIEKGKSTQPELKVILNEEFPEVGKAHTNANILSEMKSHAIIKSGSNEGKERWEVFGIGRLVVTDEKGHYCFPSETKKKKSGKKDKKGKKSKKS